MESTSKCEVRVKDPTTGGEKGTKLARFDLIPVLPLLALAEHYGRGARKYDDRNWEKGYRWGLSFAALCRHLFAWWGGEEYDVCTPECPEGCTEHTGGHHLTAVAWHSFALREFQARSLGTDDRAWHPPILLPATPGGYPLSFTQTATTEIGPSCNYATVVAECRSYQSSLCGNLACPNLAEPNSRWCKECGKRPYWKARAP